MTILEFRAFVFNKIQQILEDPEHDGHHKSYEGAVSIHYGNYWNKESIILELKSYILCPSRNHYWYGTNLEELLKRATEEIKNWDY